MEMKIGKQNLISHSDSIQDSWEVEKQKVPKGIAEIQDSFEAATESSPFQDTIFFGPLIGTFIGNSIGDASDNQNDDGQMRDDVQQTQEAQSNLERSAKHRSSWSDGLDDLYDNIAKS